jgi:hypothetical protein
LFDSFSAGAAVVAVFAFWLAVIITTFVFRRRQKKHTLTTRVSESLRRRYDLGVDM